MPTHINANPRLCTSDLFLRPSYLRSARHFALSSQCNSLTNLITASPTLAISYPRLLASNQSYTSAALSLSVPKQLISLPFQYRSNLGLRISYQSIAPSLRRHSLSVRTFPFPMLIVALPVLSFLFYCNFFAFPLRTTSVLFSLPILATFPRLSTP